MKNETIYFGQNLLSLEVKMSDWFMNFFDEKENTDNMQLQKRILFVLEKTDILVYLLMNLIKGIYSKTSTFTFVNTTVKSKTGAFTNVIFKDGYTIFYKKIVLTIVYSIFLSIFEKIFIRWIFKQLII